MLKETQFTTKGFVVWGVCALFFLYEFFLKSSLGTFQHPLMQDLHLSSLQYALLSSTTFFIMYGVMQIPVGLLIDNIGLKKTLLMGSFFCAITSFSFAYSTTYHAAMISRTFMGIGASTGFICLLVSVNEWMPHRYNGLFIGLSQFIGTMGPMLGAGPLETFLSQAQIQWQFIFKVLGGIGFCLFLMVVFFVENSHELAEKYVVLRRPEKTRVSLLKLFSCKQAWYIALFSACIYFSIEYLSANEGRTFLRLKGFSAHFSSYMITTAWVGYALGCPLLGWLSDYFERRKYVLVFSAFFCVFSLSSIVFSQERTLVIVSFFMLGVAASGQSVGFAIMGEQFKKQFIPIGLGFNNAMITAMSATSAPAIAYALERVNPGEGVSVYHYQVAFLLLIFLGMLSVVFSFFFVKETYCKSVADFNVLNASQRSK